jgi:multiple sugar transport system ATP-binding protein
MLDRRPAALSGGQRQRVAIGRAIVRQPKVFLFDEPLSNLDAQLRGEMRTEIKRLHQRLKATIIYVTHDQVEAMTLADRIAVLQAGHRMQYDTPETVYNRPAALFVAGFTGAPAMNLVDCKVADGAADLGGERIRIPAPLADKARGSASLKFGIRPENIKLAAQGGDDLVVNAEVSLLEPLGSETLVTFKIGAAEMVARCGADFRQRPGTRLAVHMNPRHLHLFDAASGAALAH